MGPGPGVFACERKYYIFFCWAKCIFHPASPFYSYSNRTNLYASSENQPSKKFISILVEVLINSDRGFPREYNMILFFLARFRSSSCFAIQWVSFIVKRIWIWVDFIAHTNSNCNLMTSWPGDVIYMDLFMCGDFRCLRLLIMINKNDWGAAVSGRFDMIFNDRM